MSVARPLRALSAMRGSSSRIAMRTPTADRYLSIHAFFTRQAHALSTQNHDPRLANYPRRFNSTTPAPSNPCANCPNPNHTSAALPSAATASTTRGHAQDYTPFVRRLIHRTQSIAHNSPHRPTKEELLAAASGGWERFRIRLKWFFIRGWRRFNTDDLSAFASWFVLGNSE